MAGATWPARDGGVAAVRRFKGDRFTRVYGSPIPVGAVVRVLRFYARRRAVIEYQGLTYLTMLWCLEKMGVPA